MRLQLFSFYGDPRWGPFSGFGNKIWNLLPIDGAPFRLHAPRHYYKPSVLHIIRAGHQGNELIPVAGRHTGIIQGLFPELGNGIVKVRRILGVDEFVELENILFGLAIYSVIECGQHLKLLLPVEGIKPDGGVLLPV